jgi:hypothetical protein
MLKINKRTMEILTNYSKLPNILLYPLKFGKKEKSPVQAEELWKNNGSVLMLVRRPGWLLCREEATQLSSLSPELKEKGINFVAILHEELGSEEFGKFFKGDLYLDPERKFFEAIGNRWLGLHGLLLPSVWKNLKRAMSAGFKGDMKGEGRLLGGVLVIGSNNQGILYEHREAVWGDHADINKIKEACQKIQITKENILISNNKENKKEEILS